MENFMARVAADAMGAVVTARAREDRAAVVLIVVAVAVVLIMGLAAAWFMYCQARGMWPAVDMPSFSSGGTWKLYCSR